MEQEKIEYAEQQAFYWLVGIDGTKTPDPRYWFDRWEVVGPHVFPGQAITAWCKRREGWLAPSEVPMVKIWERKEDRFSDLQWLHKNVQWGPGKYEAKIMVKPWEER